MQEPNSVRKLNLHTPPPLPAKVEDMAIVLLYIITSLKLISRDQFAFFIYRYLKPVTEPRWEVSCTRIVDVSVFDAVGEEDVAGYVAVDKPVFQGVRIIC